MGLASALWLCLAARGRLAALAPLHRRPLDLYRRVWLVLETNEPFAWAVYHYGRWGYDEDYGWFWVPGDTWAPAWVQWRYSDDYVGWAPVGPGRRGYAYGVPVNYEPPIAKSWVFVQPRYMTSRVISHYALPIGGLGVAFFGATNVYRPIYRGGIVYNYGMPRDRVVKIIRRPIYVQKVYKVDNWKGGKFDRDGRNKGIKIYAPNFNRDGRNRGRRNSSTIRRTSSRRRSCMTPSRATCRKVGARAPRA